MKKLSKRSEDFIELALKLEDVEHISLSKHDVKILYNYYKSSLFEIMKLENQLEVGEEQYNDLVEEIKTVVAKLNEIDNYSSSLPQKLKELEEKQLDLLHYIENNKIGTFACYRVVKELKKIRKDRRKVKNDMELSRAYISNKNKLVSSENRQFMLQNICVAEKKLGVKYNNRQYSDEELRSIVKQD